MEQNEIRIGNWISLGNRIGYIQSNWSESQYIVIDEEETQDTIEAIERFKPIELTEEWLIKFQFEKVKPRSGIQAAYKKGGIRINISNSGNFYWKNKPIPYVHILQNVYYYNELTGQELTIAQ